MRQYRTQTVPSLHEANPDRLVRFAIACWISAVVLAQEGHASEAQSLRDLAVAAGLPAATSAGGNPRDLDYLGDPTP